jgi:hypothetical protein
LIFSWRHSLRDDHYPDLVWHTKDIEPTGAESPRRITA